MKRKNFMNQFNQIKLKKENVIDFVLILVLVVFFSIKISWLWNPLISICGLVHLL